MFRQHERPAINDFTGLKAVGVVGVDVLGEAERGDQERLADMLPGIFDLDAAGELHTVLGPFLGTRQTGGLHGQRPVNTEELDILAECRKEFEVVPYTLLPPGTPRTTHNNLAEVYRKFIGFSVFDSLTSGVETLDRLREGDESLLKPGLATDLARLHQLVSFSPITLYNLHYTACEDGPGYSVSITAGDSVASVDWFDLYRMGAEFGHERRGRLAGKIGFLIDRADDLGAFQETEPLSDELAGIAQELTLRLADDAS